ncbi:MAG: cupin domain-containing protein [Thermocrispum sp.]
MKFTHFCGHGTNVRPSRLAQGWQIPPVHPTNFLRSRPRYWDPARHGRWEPTDSEGIERWDLGPASAASRWRMQAGTSFEEHDHTRDEQLVIVSGKLRFADGNRAVPGDVVVTKRGERHGATALEKTEFWLLELESNH